MKYIAAASNGGHLTESEKMVNGQNLTQIHQAKTDGQDAPPVVGHAILWGKIDVHVCRVLMNWMHPKS